MAQRSDEGSREFGQAQGSTQGYQSTTMEGQRRGEESMRGGYREMSRQDQIGRGRVSYYRSAMDRQSRRGMGRSEMGMGMGIGQSRMGEQFGASRSEQHEQLGQGYGQSYRRGGEESRWRRDFEQPRSERDYGFRQTGGREDWRSEPYGREEWREEDRGRFAREYTQEPRHEEREQRRGRWQREPVTAREVMTRNVKAVTRDSTLKDAAQIMRDENTGVVPVTDENLKLLGLLTDRDIVVRGMRDDQLASQIKVSEVMTEDVECVTPDEPLTEVIEMMGDKQVRRIPVVDREDRLVGIISMADIANRADYDDDLQEALEKISSRRSFWSRLFS
jgi:CBS domain-containing protein